MTVRSTADNHFHTPMHSADLENLLSRIASGETEALAELYHQTSTSLYAYALSILKNAQDAEDILHDSYVILHSAAAGYRPAGKPMAWIITITKNLCFQKLRERKKTVDLPPEDWEPYLESHSGISPEERLLLAACMNRLSDVERQIVVLHATAGFRHREIASLLAMPLPTVLSKYSRALKKLKNYFREGD